QNWPETAVVCITAYGSIRDAVASLQSGALDYVEKPFQDDEFLIVAERALAAKRFHQEAARKLEALDSEYGSPTIEGPTGPIRRDLEPISEVLAKLAAYLAVSDRPVRPNIFSIDSISKFDPKTLIIKSMTASLK